MYKLLIVEDNFYDREGLAELSQWQQLNFSEIHTASDGEEGLSKALEIEPLLVITDVSMPGMNGLSMAKKILEKKPATKFIFVSCFDDSALIRESIELNVFGYILKPIDVKELLSAVKKVLQINDIEQSRQEEVTKLQSQLKEQLPFIQEQIIRDLLHGNLAETDYKRLAKFHMEIIHYYAIVVIHLEDKDNTDALLDRAMIYVKANLVKQYFTNDNKEGIRVHSVLQNNGDIAALIYLDGSPDRNEAEQACFSYLSDFKDAVGAMQQVDISVCIGGISNQIEDMYELYNRAEYALDMNIYKRSNMIIMADKANATNEFLDCDFGLLKNELKALFEKGDITKCESLVDKYYGHVDAINKTIVKEFTLTLVSTVQLLLFEMNLSLSDVFSDGALVWEKLSKFNSIFDIKQWVYNLLKSIVEYCNESAGDRDAVLVGRIKKIIEEQYLSLDNVNQISEQVYVSSVHANKVFKKSMGCTMFDYLTKIKIDKAKELLRDSDYKIYEIVEMLGYKSKTYFTSLFREHTGKTPKEYRMFEEKH
ncbi:MAG: response regulator [Clostridia bacterium]|nr:response regulator [Clostridia bacterium]